jgi:hypothetical protein
MNTTSTGPSGSLLIGPVRIAYPHLLKPRTSIINGKEETRFEAVMLIPKESADLVEKVRAAIKTAFAAKFGDQVKLAKDKQPLKDGDASVTDDDADAGKYPGYFFANVKGWPDNPPQLKHADKSPITDPGTMTSGDWVYMLVKPRAYAFEATKGVALDILGARLIKKGDAIGAGGVNKAAVADALDALEIEAEADEAF